MNNLSSEQTANFLESATITHTHDTGHAFIHTGISAAGAHFVMVNDYCGRRTLIENI